MYLKDKPFAVGFAILLSHLAFALFVGLMIASFFGAVHLEHVFFPSVGAVLATWAYRIFQEKCQRKAEWVEQNRRAHEYREEQLAQRMKSPATAGGRVRVDVDLDRLRTVLHKTTAPRAGVEPTRPWGDEPKTKDSGDTPHRRRSDKPVETSASTDPLPITSPAHPLHAQTYGSTFGNTNADTYPAKEVVSHEAHRAPCSPSPSHYDSSPSYSPSYDSSPSYSSSCDSSSGSSDSGSCGGGCD